MSIPRGTTPTFNFTFDGIDLNSANNVYITFSQGANNLLTKSGDALEIIVEGVEDEGQTPTSTVLVYLNQEETLSFSTNSLVEIQVNWTFPGGRRACSEVAKYHFGKQLLNEVVE